MRKMQEFNVKVCFKEYGEKERRAAVNEKLVRLISTDRQLH